MYQSTVKEEFILTLTYYKQWFHKVVSILTLLEIYENINANTEMWKPV